MLNLNFKVPYQKQGVWKGEESNLLTFVVLGGKPPGTNAGGRKPQ